MTDHKNYKDYEINEEDIDKAIHILSVYDPGNATAENAIDFLIYLRTGVHEMAHEKSLDELEKLYKEFANQS